MNYLLDNMHLYFVKLLAISLFLLTLGCSGVVEPVLNPGVDPILKQAVFATPEAAANTFVYAVKTADEALLSQVIRPDFYQVLQLDSLSSKDVDNFIRAWNTSNALLPQGNDKVLLAIGEDKWTFPIPIVKGSTGWYFDIEEGLERMRIRRIGRNELATMQTVLAYYDAQMEYAEQDRNGDGVLEYAQKLMSTLGMRDGLFWEVQAGEPPSPLGRLLADRTSGQGYNGYFYRILTAQGPDAKGGAYSYLIGGHMSAGFAMIAWPAEYGESGVMSFIVSHAGIVYEQNLGFDSAAIAEKMSVYNPGKGWVAAQEVGLPLGAIAPSE